LLEGDATLAGFRYEERTQSLAPRAPEDFARDYGVEWAEAAHPETPRLLRETFLLQYPAGYDLASRLADAGGIAALDAALRDPPLSSEEVLNPELYLDPRRRRPLVELPVEATLGRGDLALCGEVLFANSLGEIGLRIWARERGAGVEASRELAAGWDGDRAAVLECREGRAIAWLVQFDDEPAAARFAAGAASLAVGLAAERGLVEPARIDRSGRRVLLSSGLSPAARDALLVELAARSFPDLGAFLGAHPEVGERGRALRDRARELP
jgi:hypothetical protein